jgi:hypothetical protein
MSLASLIRERRERIAEGWIEEILAVYSPDASAIFSRQTDPFANPLGHSVREGANGLLEALLNGTDPMEVRLHLRKLVKIRAVQDLTPSEALSFVFSLKDVLRKEIPQASTDPQYHAAMLEMDSKIDEVALAAFELFVEARDEVSRLRISEVKRQVAWVLDKINRRESVPAEVPTKGNGMSSGSRNDRKEDHR